MLERPDGSSYEGEFRDDMMNGFGEMSYVFFLSEATECFSESVNYITTKPFIISSGTTA